jgi:hypothetical protein
MFAAISANLECLALALDLGADPDFAPDPWQQTALFVLAANDAVRCMRLLLPSNSSGDSGATTAMNELNQKTKTKKNGGGGGVGKAEQSSQWPWWHFVLNNRRQCADPNLADVYGHTPFSVSCALGNCASVALLLDEPTVDVNRADARGIFPLLYACLHVGRAMRRRLGGDDDGGAVEETQTAAVKGRIVVVPEVKMATGSRLSTRRGRERAEEREEREEKEEAEVKCVVLLLQSRRVSQAALLQAVAECQHYYNLPSPSQSSSTTSDTTVVEVAPPGGGGGGGGGGGRPGLHASPETSPPPPPSPSLPSS